MYEDFIAGWLAGGAGLLIGHPLDTVKSRLQTVSTYDGIVDCLGKTIRHESVAGLYKGMLVPFATVGVLHSLLFVGYGTTLRLLHPDDTHIDSRKDLPMSEIALATIVGSIIQLMPAVPIEVVKTNLQIQKERIVHFWESSTRSFNSSASSGIVYKGPLDCMKTIYRQGGIRALYKGGTVMFHRDVIGYLFYIPVYELIYRHLSKASNSHDTFAQVIAGGTAGSLCWFSICPLEVIKNRLQTSQISSTTSPSFSLFKYAMQLYRQEGFTTFYKGGLTLIIRGFPVSAVLFVVYSKSMSLLQD